MLGSAAGSLVGTALFYYTGEPRFFSSDAPLFAFYFGGMLALFGVMTWTAHLAGNNWRQSMRIAGRRGLFTYTVTTATIIAASPWLAGITLESTVGEFLRFIVNAQIFVGAVTTLFDFGSTIVSDMKSD